MPKKQSKKNKEPFISIIIPCREIDKYTEECIKYCQKLDYKNFEIIVLTDSKTKLKGKKVKIIATGKVKPAIKRNIGMKVASGEIYAFIDSDAFPEKNWLKEAVKHLEDKDIAMVGGPNLTPPEAHFMEQISGEILASPLASGPAYIRYTKADKQYVKELPSCNFFVKKQYAGKFDPELLTAEDSKFCFDIGKKARIVYEPDVIVYHHRRNTFEGHLKQIWVYGRDIALLTKKEFSFDKLYYSLPSLFVLFIFFGFLLSLTTKFREIYWSLVFLYILIVLAFSIRKNIEKTILIFSGIVLTHFSYGLGYLYGLFLIKKTGLNIR
ncbi:glycosyltransferase [Candidatus Pacearchaeota archaeon]|nr:glycosyltransferase [Candidatus Pacearchaeota archaeon]